MDMRNDEWLRGASFLWLCPVARANHTHSEFTMEQLAYGSKIVVWCKNNERNAWFG